MCCVLFGIFSEGAVIRRTLFMITSYKKAKHAAPSDTMASLKKFTIVAVIGLAAAVSVMTAASDGKTAYINDEGTIYTVAADSNNIGDILSEAGVTLYTGDETVVTEETGDKINIDVKRAFTVVIDADDRETMLRLTGGTVGEALEKAGVRVSPNDFVEPAANTELAEGMQIDVRRGVKLYLEKNGETELVYVPEGTVKDALKSVGCELCSEGNGKIKPDSAVTSGMKVCVDEVLYRTTFKTEKIEPDVIKESCDTMPVGKTVVKQEGKQGKIETSYKEKYVNGQLVEKTEDSKTVVTKTVSRIVLVGTKGAFASGEAEQEQDEDERSEFEEIAEEIAEPEEKTEINSEPETEIGEDSDVEREVVVKSGEDFSCSEVISGVCTAYNEIDGITAIGTTPQVGTVAVDPNVIPYGTRLYICSSDGSFVYGYAVAEDTGDACMAGDIVVDLYMDSEEECNEFGRQTLDIYILD